LNTPKISIVVPVYNAASHIPTLVAIVQAQTFKEWELILVNDGSKDNTAEVCKQFAKEDARIRLITQPNQGPSAARNTGIDAAKGEWINFMDADDSLLDCFLFSMYEVANQSRDIDIAYAGYIIVEQSRNDIYTYNTAVYEGFDSVRKAMGETNILHRCPLWGKLFRRSIMADKNLRFDTGLSHSEDRLFVYNYLLHTRGIATTSAIGYLYDSTTTTSLKNKHLAVEVLCHRQRMLQQAAHALVDQFKLEGEQVFKIAQHLIGLFSNSIQSLYYDYGNTTETVRQQKAFYDEFFDKELYRSVSNCKRWKTYESGDQRQQWALAQNFKAINKHLNVIDKKIAVSKFYAKLTYRRETAHNFARAVILLNRTIK